MIICISGDYRSGKSGFGKVIAKKLNLKYFSMRTLKEQENSNYNTDFVNWSKQIDSDENLIIDKCILEFAKKGDCVLDFRYAALLCKRYKIKYIGIWISADIDTRVYGNSYCWKKPKAEVKNIIYTREKQEKDTCKKIYNADYASEEYYKYFIDLSEYWYPIEEVSERGFQFQSLIEEMSIKIMEEALYV